MLSITDQIDVKTVSLVVGSRLRRKPNPRTFPTKPLRTRIALILPCFVGSSELAFDSPSPVPPTSSAKPYDGCPMALTGATGTPSPFAQLMNALTRPFVYISHPPSDLKIVKSAEAGLVVKRTEADAKVTDERIASLCRRDVRSTGHLPSR